MSPLNELSNLFEELPGIGPRQAKRFVYYLLRRNKSFLRKMSSLILKLSDEIRECEECFQFFESENNNTLCRICRSKNRDQSQIMVVERDVDLENVERAGIFNGKYFVLGGTVDLSDEDKGNGIRTKKLESRVKKEIEDDVLEEVIIATNATSEGDFTAHYIKKILEPWKKKGLKITSLGRGLSTGTELEYSDEETLRNALQGRK